MRCWGRNRNYSRCKNECKFIFCRVHKYQRVVFFVSVLTTLGLVAGLYRDIVEPFMKNGDSENPLIIKSEGMLDIPVPRFDTLHNFIYFQKVTSKVFLLEQGYTIINPSKESVVINNISFEKVNTEGVTISSYDYESTYFLETDSFDFVDRSSLVDSDYLKMERGFPIILSANSQKNISNSLCFTS